MKLGEITLAHVHHHASKHLGHMLATMAEKHPVVGGLLLLTGVGTIIHLASAKKTGPTTTT